MEASHALHIHVGPSPGDIPLIEQAIVLAGGKGTRLNALTKDAPKPLLDVGDRPFLLWLYGELRRQGVRQIIVSAGFKGEKVAALFASVPGVGVVIEPHPLGTGGALAFVKERLAERFFFLNGDSLFDIDLSTLASAHTAGDGMLALRPMADISRYGAVSMEGSRITHFDNMGDRSGPGLINGGVAVLTRSFANQIEPGKPVSIERDVYPQVASKGLLHGRIYNRPFIDIGAPEDFERAQKFIPELLRDRPSC
jgi:D-glycero-D-manno-heptose 1,7-bisphosphate phosphatase